MEFDKIQKVLLGKHIYFSNKGVIFKMQITKDNLTPHRFDSSHANLRLSARHEAETFCGNYEFDLHDLHHAYQKTSSVRSIVSPISPNAITISFKPLS